MEAGLRVRSPSWRHSGLTQKAAQHVSSRGPEDSDLLGVPPRDVQGQLVPWGQLGRTLGPQNHGRHVIQIWRGRPAIGLLMIVDIVMIDLELLFECAKVKCYICAPNTRLFFNHRSSFEVTRKVMQ